jgi:hypothetical protein
MWDQSARHYSRYWPFALSCLQEQPRLSSYFGRGTGFGGAITLHGATRIDTGTQSLNWRKKMRCKMLRMAHSRSLSQSQISGSQFMTLVR